MKNPEQMAQRWPSLAALTGTILFGLIIGITAGKHELWFDEAQAWLLVRDLAPADLLLHYLRYEGHPSLWYLVLLFPVKLGMPYSWLPAIPVACAIFTAWWILRNAPFPPFITWMLPFGYFFLFQYGIIARNYVLIPPILLMLAHYYPSRTARPVAYLTLVTLLMHTSLHGTVMAMGFAAAGFLQTVRGHVQSGQKVFARYMLGVVGLNGLLLYSQLSFPDGLIYTVGTVQKAPLQMLNYSVTGLMAVSIPVWLIFLVWFYRQKLLLYYLIPFAGLMMLNLRVFKVWHEGLLVLLLVHVLWISFMKPGSGSENLPAPVDEIGPLFRMGLLTTMGCMLAIHIVWGIRAVDYEIRHSYSGAPACAEMLRETDLADKNVWMLGYNVVGVQPFFDNSPFKNYPGPHTFWFWSSENPLARLLLTDPDNASAIMEFKRAQPDILVIGVYDKRSEQLLDDILNQTSYHVVHTSAGIMGWKGDPYQADTFYMLRRTAF